MKVWILIDEETNLALEVFDSAQKAYNKACHLSKYALFAENYKKQLLETLNTTYSKNKDYFYNSEYTIITYEVH